MEDLTVTITVDTSLFDEALARAIEAATRSIAAIAPVVWGMKLAGQRDRSRLVTRRKQRRRW